MLYGLLRDAGIANVSHIYLQARFRVVLHLFLLLLYIIIIIIIIVYYETNSNLYLVPENLTEWQMVIT
jgi:hypothetical protein